MPSRMCAVHHSDAIDALTTFEEGMVLIKDVLQGIILTAQAVLMSLDNLEARISVLGDIAVKEGLVATKARDELLAELWTFFGANRAELAHFSRTFEVLQHLGSYKQSLTKYILATIEAVETLQVDAEQTRITAVGNLFSPPKSVALSLEVFGVAADRLKERTSTVRGQISGAEVADRGMYRSVTRGKHTHP